MTYLLDTHTLYWFFENPGKLGKKSLKILLNKDNQFVIPSIVLAELKYIFKKHRNSRGFTQIFNEITNDPQCIILTLDEDIIKLIPTKFEMHDGIIIASSLHFGKINGEPISILTKDKEIIRSGLVKTIW